MIIFRFIGRTDHPQRETKLVERLSSHTGLGGRGVGQAGGER